MIEPGPGSISASALRVVMNTPRRFTAITRSQSATLYSWVRGVLVLMPALLIRTSMRRKFVGDPLPEIVDRIFVGHVDRHRLRFAARLLGERGGLVRAREILVGADHGCAECGKPKREGAAEAVARAGDHGDLAVEAKELVVHVAVAGTGVENFSIHATASARPPEGLAERGGERPEGTGRRSRDGNGKAFSGGGRGRRAGRCGARRAARNAGHHLRAGGDAHRARAHPQGAEPHPPHARAFLFHGHRR